MIRPATVADTKSISRLIHALAEYERLSDVVDLDESKLSDHLFGPRPFAEVLLAEEAGNVVGYALFFPSYSTFLGNPGIWLESPNAGPPDAVRATQLPVGSAVTIEQSVKSGRGTLIREPSGAPRPSRPWQEAHAAS